MNDIQIFKNDEFGEVRSTVVDGKTYLCATDIATILGYTNPHKSIRDHCTEDGVTICSVIDSVGRTQQAKFISEGNVYRLIVKSKLPNAQKFEKWVFDEVLPQIRATGTYMSDIDIWKKMTSPENMIAIGTKMKEMEQQISQLECKIDNDAPKVLFADAVTTSDTVINVRDLAKIINQNGYPMGEKRLYKWMRENAYILQGSTSPTQKAMNMGLFAIQENIINVAGKKPLVTQTTKVTMKGQQYFINKLISKE